MHLCVPITLLLVLAGCDGGTHVVDDPPKDTGTDDTGGDTDETGDSGDSGDTGETGDTGVAEPNVAWDLAGDFDGMSFSLVSLNVDDFSMADIVAEAAAAARVELALDPPDDYLEPSDVPGMYLAFFVGAVHNDDGDDRWDPDEDWYGASSFLTVYIDGVIPPEILDLGLHSGWNSLILSGGDNLVVGDPMAQPLPISFNDQMTLSGTSDATISPQGRVATLAGAVFSGAQVDALDDVALMDGDWSLEFDGAPPSDHYADVDGDGGTEAVELVVAYADGDESGSLSLDGSDTMLGLGCVDEVLLVGWWIAPSPDLTALMNVSQFGGSVGWNALLLDDAGGTRVATAAEAQRVVLSANCTLE